MAREKIKFALRIAPETQQLVKDLCARDNCQSQNEFIEKAIRFYAGYVSSGEAIDYLPPALVAALRGTVEDSEHRIARLLFKLAVETNMMMNVLAAGMEISEEDLRQLRARCVREVKQTNGNISLKDAVKYQKGQEKAVTENAPHNLQVPVSESRLPHCDGSPQKSCRIHRYQGWR